MQIEDFVEWFESVYQLNGILLDGELTGSQLDWQTFRWYFELVKSIVDNTVYGSVRH